MSSDKIKILLMGTIGDNVEDFVQKLVSLQQSKAGPFDACFCVGRVNSSIMTRSNDLPMPIYLQNASGLTEHEGFVELAPNINVFATACVQSLTIGKQHTASSGIVSSSSAMGHGFDTIHKRNYITCILCWL